MVDEGSDRSKRAGPDILDLVEKLGAISEAKQRSHALAHRLKGLDVESILLIVKTIHERALAGQESYLRLYNGLMVQDTLTNVLGRQIMSQLVEMAQRLGYYEVVSILMDMTAPDQVQNATQPFLDSELKEFPLGMRKSLARRPDFKTIERVSRDQDHRVIANLLNNPRLTEKEVVRMAATRPTSAKVLQAIYDHPKWVVRYSVKKAIVLNPHAPQWIALRLLAFITSQHLEQITRDRHLSPVVVNEAQRILDLKRNKSSGKPQ